MAVKTERGRVAAPYLSISFLKRWVMPFWKSVLDSFLEMQPIYSPSGKEGGLTEFVIDMFGKSFISKVDKIGNLYLYRTSEDGRFHFFLNSHLDHISKPPLGKFYLADEFIRSKNGILSADPKLGLSIIFHFVTKIIPRGSAVDLFFDVQEEEHSIGSYDFVSSRRFREYPAFERYKKGLGLYAYSFDAELAPGGGVVPWVYPKFMPILAHLVDSSCWNGDNKRARMTQMAGPSCGRNLVLKAVPKKIDYLLRGLRPFGFKFNVTHAARFGGVTNLFSKYAFPVIGLPAGFRDEHTKKEVVSIVALRRISRILRNAKFEDLSK